MRKNKYILRTKYCYMYSEYIKHHRNEFIFLEYIENVKSNSNYGDISKHYKVNNEQYFT